MTITIPAQPYFLSKLLNHPNRITDGAEVEGPFSWTGNSGLNANVIYSTDVNFASDYRGVVPIQLGSDEILLVEEALGTWSKVANIIFTPLDKTLDPMGDNLNLAFAKLDIPLASTVGGGLYPTFFLVI